MDSSYQASRLDCRPAKTVPHFSPFLNRVLHALCAWCLGISLVSRLIACPFCSAISNSLREDIRASDYVVLAVCTRPGDINSELPTNEFRIYRIFVGDERWLSRDVEVVAFRHFTRGDVSLLFGARDSTQTDWGATEPLSLAAQTYIRELAKRMSLKRAQPARMQMEGKTEISEPLTENTRDLACDLDWLRFFWTHLDDEDEWIRRDAFNEFARASLDDLRSAADIFDAEVLRKRIADENCTVELRRLYWTLLSLCDRGQDASFPESYIFRALEHPRVLAGDDVGMDAAISCYLVLGGENALKKIETELLLNPNAFAADRYAAIVALRIHATEFKGLPKNRICQALSRVLWDAEMADLVIPDLARLEDWSHVERLVELFEMAEHEQKFLRIPVINYLRACPLTDAKTALEKCRQIDPDCYRRAVTFFPTLTADDTHP